MKKTIKTAYGKTTLVTLITVILMLTVSEFSANCSKVNFDGEILRFHVLANSDEPFDQNLKLKVRDRVLLASEKYTKDACSAEIAEENLRRHASELRSEALAVIREEGYGYDAQIQFGVFEFPEKSYGCVTLPKGKYNAVRVIIGGGEGHNWWCVMYPPLCCVNETMEFDKKYFDVLSDSTKEKIIRKPEYKIKFKVAEIVKNSRNKKEKK